MLAAELRPDHPDAAGSLLEGLEEMFSVRRLGIGGNLAEIPRPLCGLAFEPSGRRQYCSTPCRQAAFRSKNPAPRKPVVAKAATVHQCPLCEERYLGDQYCNDCGAFCRRLGPGGPVPLLRRSCFGDRAPYPRPVPWLS